MERNYAELLDAVGLDLTGAAALTILSREANSTEPPLPVNQRADPVQAGTPSVPPRARRGLHGPAGRNTRDPIPVHEGGQTSWVSALLDLEPHVERDCRTRWAEWEPALRQFGYSLLQPQVVLRPTAFVGLSNMRLLPVRAAAPSDGFKQDTTGS